MSINNSNKNQVDNGVETYFFEGKAYFKVIVQKRDKSGKIIKKSSRFSKLGKRITSQAGINQVKLELYDDLNKFIDQKSVYTWQAWKEYCIKKMRDSGLKETTIVNYDGMLERWKDPCWCNKLLSEITKEDVYQYLFSFLVNKEATDWTRKNIYKSLHKFFEMAVDDGEISKNPSRGIVINTLSDQGVALTSEEVRTLLTKANLVSHPYYSHWVIALLTGLRNGELLALRYKKINFDSNTILIDEQFTSKDGLHLPKKGKVRTIDLGPELKEFILELKSKIGPQSAKLWRHKRKHIETDEIISGRKTGRKVLSVKLEKEYIEHNDFVLPRMRSWTKGGQASHLREFCRKIGIREAKFHDLRATHITNLLNNGVSISKVMRQVGHSKMSTTDAYHRLAGVEIKGITKQLSFSIPKANTTTENLPEKTSQFNNVIRLFPNKATS